VELQISADSRANWIDYSTLDAQATWLLRESLECKLRNMPADSSRYIVSDEAFRQCATMWEFYEQYWKPFGALLVSMEKEGMLVDSQQLQEAEKLAKQHQEEAEKTFRKWASQRCADARWMNVGSGAQVRRPQASLFAT
jgi:DNA polymerase-1